MLRVNSYVFVVDSTDVVKAFCVQTRKNIYKYKYLNAVRGVDFETTGVSNESLSF